MSVWRCRRMRLAYVTGALGVLVAQAAGAQGPFGLGRWQGKATFFLDWEKQSDRRSHTRYETILFQERLGLRNDGAFVVDPRFLSLSLGGSFGRSQEDGLAVVGNSLRAGNGALYDYAFEGRFVPDTASPVTLFANRDDNTLNQGFGGRSEVSFQSHGGIWELREDSALEHYGLRNFSALLDVHQEILKENSAVFGTPYRRDETHNVVRYRAQKGGETSDLHLSYELDDVSDPLHPTNVFDSHTVRATYSRDFGPTLNRRSDSNVYYFTRGGSVPGSSVFFDETLHLDHREDFGTDYRYNFSQSDAAAGVTTTNAASAGLLHRLYRALTTTLDARALHQEFPAGGQLMYGGQTGFAYRRSLPGSGQLFADTSVGYQVDDNNFTASSLDVVDEPHRAPQVLGAGSGFVLDKPFVQNDSIVVTDVRGGARLPTVLNVDYVLSQEGSRTRIIPLPGSPAIRPDDPLEVTYTFHVDPSIRYSTTSLATRTGVEFPSVAASYEYLLGDQSRLSGTATPGFLIASNVNRLKLEVRRQWRRVRAQSTVAYEIANSTIIDSTSWRFGQLVTYQPRSQLIAQLSGDQYLVAYPGQARQAHAYLVRAALDWMAPAGLAVSAFSGYRAFHDTAVPSDEIIDCGVRMRWTYQRVEVAPSVTWTDYQRRLMDIRGELRLTRHLF